MDILIKRSHPSSFPTQTPCSQSHASIDDPETLPNLNQTTMAIELLRLLLSATSSGVTSSISSTSSTSSTCPNSSSSLPSTPNTFAISLPNATPLVSGTDV